MIGPIPGCHLYRVSCTECTTETIAALDAIEHALCDQCRRTGIGTAAPTTGCQVCGNPTTHLYPAGRLCDDHPPKPRTDFYGFSIPITHTAYDPQALTRPAAELAWKTLGDPPPDSPYQAHCGHCRTTWPLHQLSHAADSIPVHDLVNHQPDGWIIGPAGGATGRICNPCGGADQYGRPYQKPAGPRHHLCEAGQRRGRGRSADCDCRHRPDHRVQPHLHRRGIVSDVYPRPCPTCAAGRHEQCYAPTCGCLADHPTDDTPNRNFKKTKRARYPDREPWVKGGWT
jgi:hypothetical protein